MNSEQRAIIALAEKEGVSPIEKDARLIVHGMVNATRDQMRKHQQGWDKLGEQQQDAVIANLTEDYNELALTIARAIASARTPFVIATCKKLEVSNGNFTATIKSDQANYNDLISRVQDKGEVVIALYERQFRDGMDDIQADKDQKSLPLDADPEQKPEKKPRAASGAKSAGGIAKTIEIPPKLLDDARKFVTEQQNPTYAGLQNKLGIGLQKAERILELLAEEGVVEFVGDEKTGSYQLVRNSAPAGEANESGGSDDESGDLAPAGETGPITELTDDLYASIVAKTTEKGQATAGALAVTFDISFEIAEQAFDRMELEGVIDAEGNLAESETFPVMD